jgi:hypothetical protein
MRKNSEMNDWAETDLAWELAEIAGPYIPDHDRTQIYTTIGAGYSYAGIDTLLGILVQAGVPISPMLVDKLVHWLDAYMHHDDAPRLREMLDAIRSLG